MRRARRTQKARSDIRRAVPLAQQHPGDDESRHDEEGVDAEVAAARPAEDVEADDGQHGHGPEALDVGAPR